MVLVISAMQRVFQPAPPARRATFFRRQSDATLDISTRAPRTEGDPTLPGTPSASGHFNPRPPHGGRPCFRIVPRYSVLFQPAPPARRATSEPVRTSVVEREFQPAPPARRATHLDHGAADVLFEFQPAPPARRATSRCDRTATRRRYFNPRPPHGGRLQRGG